LEDIIRLGKDYYFKLGEHYFLTPDSIRLVIMKLSAEEVRVYVQRQYVEPARYRGEKEVTIQAGDIHDEMNLRSLQPLVCDTLRGRKLQKPCNIRLVREQRGRRVRQRHAKNIWFTYELLQT